MNNDLLKPSIAEFLGTFTLVFIGGLAGSVSSQAGTLVPALAHGLILVGIVYAYRHHSGAHVNPAVTAGLLVGGKIKLNRAIYYWIAQILGAVAAALVINLVAPNGAAAAQTKGSLTDTALWTAVVLEFVLTFFLITAVYQAAVFGKAGNLAGVAIGLTLGASIVAGGALSGASLNPARTFGPALIAGDLSYLLPYWVGMFAASIAAGLVHTQLLPAIIDTAETSGRETQRSKKR